jgi:hypothetical protein
MSEQVFALHFILPKYFLDENNPTMYALLELSE